MGESSELLLRVIGVYSQQEQNKGLRHFVRLYDIVHTRQLYLWVGQFEAWAIATALEGKPDLSPNLHPASRDIPYVHRLILTLLQSCDGTLEKVCINDVQGETFYALAFLRVGDKVHEIDLRPSDALALALRAKCPIYSEEAVMDAAGQRVS